ncbi:MAG: DsbA family oxidoreductase [Nitrospirota bacterium]
MTDRGLTVEVYSDIVCPWCYVGKRRLERALTSVGGDIHVTWRPFQLNPTMSSDGMDRATYLKAKFGSLENFGRMEEQLLAAGVEERIPFAFEKIQRTPNTFAAHRLVWYAEQQGKQDAMVEALFRGYFLEGKNIGDVTTLTHVAAEAGLDRTETEEFLASEKGVVEVTAEEAAGHRLGIRSVPYFVINGSLSISGAQPPDIFISAFQQAKETAMGRKEGA